MYRDYIYINVYGKMRRTNCMCIGGTTVTIYNRNTKKVLTVFLCTNTYKYLGLRRAEIIF